YFNDACRDSSLRYLADGVTESLIDQLSAIRALDVISRNGVAPFRGRDIPRDSIARALDAGTLVEGEVEPVGTRARVTIRLVDGASGADVGRRQSFELPVDAPLAIRDSLVNQAAILLRERLGDEVQLREQHASTKNVAAWSLVQRAERLRKDADARPNEALGLSARADSMLAEAERADPRWIDPIILRGQLLDRRARLTRSLPALFPVVRSRSTAAGPALVSGRAAPVSSRLSILAVPTLHDDAARGAGCATRVERPSQYRFALAAAAAGPAASRESDVGGGGDCAGGVT